MPKGIYAHKPSQGFRKNNNVGALNKGRKCTEEQILRMSKAQQGKRLSEEHRRKLSIVNKGAGNGFYGKHHTPESLEKIRLAHLGKPSNSSTKFKKGNVPWTWRGGITPINIKIRSSLEYSFWRKSCLKRDNFTCQKTGIIGGDLVVHHINNFAEFPELRFAIDNGITLSEKSHVEFHKKYGKRNNTKEQIVEFLSAIHNNP